MASWSYAKRLESSGMRAITHMFDQSHKRANMTARQIKMIFLHFFLFLKTQGVSAKWQMVSHIQLMSFTCSSSSMLKKVNMTDQMFGRQSMCISFSNHVGPKCSKSVIPAGLNLMCMGSFRDNFTRQYRTSFV